MSRTGVGVRVLVDGNQLDDGCLDWTRPPGGTVLRRNLVPSPRGVLGWTTSTGFADLGEADWLRLTVASVTTPYMFTPAIPEMIPAGTVITGKMESRRPTNAQLTPDYGILQFRVGGTYSGPRMVFALPFDQVVPMSVTWTTPADIPAGQLRLAWVGGTSAGGFAAAQPGYVADVRRPMVDLLPQLGTFFDGNSADTATEEYRWNGSISEAVEPATAPRLPYGLSADNGLRITWGRSDTVEQPTPSTCTFRVIDDFESQYFTAFGIGSMVQVLADAKITGGDTVPAFTDPDFETQLRATTKNATASRDNRHVETGTVSAVLAPINGSLPYSFQLPPGELQAAGTNPNAWDGLPHLSPGETWHLAVRVWVPAQVSVQARAVIYTGPYASAATLGAVIGNAYDPTVSQWYTLEADISPGVQLGWIGVQIEATGGMSWADTDPATWASYPDELQWRDLANVSVDHVSILAPAGGTTVTMLVFGGRITDMESQWDADAAALDVTATDFLGDLGNRYVGDEPWLLEPLSTRMLRVLKLAQVPGEQPVTADIATTLGPTPLTWEDVDHRAAAGLLTDMANSVDGVLWSASHVVTGPYVKLEDPGQRPALYQLDLVGGYITIVQVDPSTLPPDQRPLDVSACDVLRDPVRWVLDVSDIATRTTVSWMEQTLNDEGQPAPTQRTQATIDPAREATYGTRNVSVQTMLTTAAAADQVADRILARASGEWRMQGLSVADADFVTPDQTAVNVLLTLLDGVKRGGMAIRVVDLPAWSPLGQAAPAYVEGGTYSYVDGGWQLDLTVSRATGLGRNAQWDQLPDTWQWDQWEPGITWDELRGVAAPGHA